MSKIERLAQILSIAIFLSIALSNAAAQYMYDVGNPSYTTMSPVELGFINLGNGDLHLEIPLYSSPQRGGRPFWAKMVYDSGIWKPVLGGSLT